MDNAIATIEQIESHFSQLRLDIRESNNGRWIDQKVTPDILSAISEAILSHRKDSVDEEFTMKSLWDDPKLSELMTEVFSKPSLENPSANNEYDKVISQPLRALAYANIISMEQRSRRNFFKLNSNIHILKYIAHREVNAYKYLCIYIKKVLQDSGLWGFFSRFLENSSSNDVSMADYRILKEKFEQFSILNTPINNVVETRRIFTKVINPLACEFNARGTFHGRLSPHNIKYSELLYNRENFRDLDKDKRMTREEYKLKLESSPSFKYTINKSIKQARDRFKTTELLDGSEVTRETVIHHIFMKNERPYLAGHLENLINLTPNQHVTKAHPSMNFQVVDPYYQKKFLIKKIFDTKQSEISADGFYSKENLIEVLNVGLGVDSFNQSDNYQILENKLINIYSERFSV